MHLPTSLHLLVNAPEGHKLQCARTIALPFGVIAAKSGQNPDDIQMCLISLKLAVDDILSDLQKSDVISGRCR